MKKAIISIAHDGGADSWLIEGDEDPTSGQMRPDMGHPVEMLVITPLTRDRQGWGTPSFVGCEQNNPDWFGGGGGMVLG